MLELEKVNICIQSVSFKSLVLGLLGYGNYHFMLEKTEFNKLKSDCKGKYYTILNTIAFCLLKQYMSNFKTTLFFSFSGLGDSFKKAHLLIIFVYECVQCWYIITLME